MGESRARRPAEWELARLDGYRYGELDPLRANPTDQAPGLVGKLRLGQTDDFQRRVEFLGRVKDGERLPDRLVHHRRAIPQHDRKAESWDARFEAGHAVVERGVVMLERLHALVELGIRDANHRAGFS